MSGSGLEQVVAQVAPFNYDVDVALGNVPGISSRFRDGCNDDITTSNEDIWNVGGVQTYLSAPSTFSVVSSSVNDISAGTGANNVRLEGLDGSFNEISETIGMNGTTPVISSNSYIRMFDAIVTSAGSTESNEGVITFDSTAPVLVQGQIQIGINRSQTFQYTVPAAKTALLTRLSLSAGNNDQMGFTVFIRPSGGVFTEEIFIQIIGTPFEYNFSPYLVVPQMSDIRIFGIRLTGTGPTRGTAQLQLYLSDN